MISSTSLAFSLSSSKDVTPSWVGVAKNKLHAFSLNSPRFIDKVTNLSRDNAFSPVFGLIKSASEKNISSTTFKENLSTSKYLKIS